MKIAVVSDIHYASAAEQRRPGYEQRSIGNPVLRAAAHAYRHYVWLRDPFAHNGLLDRFCGAVGTADLVVANGDYSCDSAFVGVSDDAAFESAQQCLERLRQRFGNSLRTNLGDHELGKLSLFGGHGGLRLASWHRAADGLSLPPFWRHQSGPLTLLGVTSSLIAFPVYESESLPEERAEWWRLRDRHLAEVRDAFEGLSPGDRVLLFVHDPTALPFLAQEPAVARRLGQIQATIVGHLHSRLVLTASRWLAGMPPIGFLGHTVRRLSRSLQRARGWRPFKVHLCPSLAGIEVLKDGGFLELETGDGNDERIRVRFHRILR